ncbi:unnamed protein product [Ectocarpus sp. CCAP 1310/34]|nr:unnamed protein product [Ectocarpus sp. CCAP 1310/34]
MYLLLGNWSETTEKKPSASVGPPLWVFEGGPMYRI